MFYNEKRLEIEDPGLFHVEGTVTFAGTDLLPLTHGWYYWPAGSPNPIGPFSTDEQALEAGRKFIRPQQERIVLPTTLFERTLSDESTDAIEQAMDIDLLDIFDPFDVLGGDGF